MSPGDGPVDAGRDRPAGDGPVDAGRDRPAGGRRALGHPGRRGRRVGDRMFWAACGVAFLLIAAPCVSVVVSVFHQAAPGLTMSLLTETTASTAGLQNAILGTLVLLVGVLIVAGVVGVAAGVWLAEFAPPRLGAPLRFVSEVLSGVPSIVIGYVGYVALVVGLHWQEGLLPAVLALSALVLPYIVKTTEVALRQVPATLREATEALGLHRAPAVVRVLLPPAVPGIVSGIIVALAISTGETAPLLFTAGFSNENPSFHLLHHQLGYLTYVSYTNVSIPGRAYAVQGAAAAAVTLVILLLLIAAGRVVSARARRATERMSL
ncbi:MAG TPA: ABC transporter permease subunit [Acidimicrobiales bacterium]|nr:ABC transporter permease subunit [Acidimicrobiales bacterium]